MQTCSCVSLWLASSTMNLRLRKRQSLVRTDQERAKYLSTTYTLASHGDMFGYDHPYPPDPNFSLVNIGRFALTASIFYSITIRACSGCQGVPCCISRTVTVQLCTPARWKHAADAAMAWLARQLADWAGLARYIFRFPDAESRSCSSHDAVQ